VLLGVDDTMWVAEKLVFSLLYSFPLTIGLKKETITLSIGLEI